MFKTDSLGLVSRRVGYEKFITIAQYSSRLMCVLCYCQFCDLALNSCSSSNQINSRSRFGWFVLCGFSSFEILTGFTWRSTLPYKTAATVKGCFVSSSWVSKYDESVRRTSWRDKFDLEQLCFQCNPYLLRLNVVARLRVQYLIESAKS